MNKKYEKIGGGSYGVYRKKKESIWPTVVVAIVILVLLGTCLGGCNVDVANRSQDTWSQAPAHSEK